MSESRWNAEDIVDGGPLGGGPEKLVDRVESALYEAKADDAAEIERESYGEGHSYGFDEGETQGENHGRSREREAVMKYLSGVEFGYVSECADDSAGAIGNAIDAIRNGEHYNNIDVSNLKA